MTERQSLIAMVEDPSVLGAMDLEQLITEAAELERWIRTAPIDLIQPATTALAAVNRERSQRTRVGAREPASLEIGAQVLGGMDTEPAGTEVMAYALRWNTVSRSTEGQLLRTRRGCLDQWLEERPADVPVVVGHGRSLDDFDQRSAVLAEPIGTFSNFESDYIGLLAVGHYDDSFIAGETLNAIRSGVLTAYSCHLRALVVEPSAYSTPDGETVFDIVRAELVEAGPTLDPVDEGALIVMVDGEDLRVASPVSELQFARDQWARQFEETDEWARQRVRDAEWVASHLAKARRNAESAYMDARSPWRRRDDLDRAHEFEREADRLDTELRDLLCNDQELYDSLAAEFRVPPKVDLIDRLKALA